MREGKYGLGATVKVQSVKRALRHVAQRLVLYPDPRKASPAQQQLDLHISWLLKSFQDSDPMAEPTLALPVSTITAISQNYLWNPQLNIVADLVTIVFFYLLRVVNTCHQPSPEQNALSLFGGVIFASGGMGDYFSTPLDLLSSSWQIVQQFALLTPKWQRKGAVVHHEAFCEAICPVAALPC
jgi:hypothetical protein